MDGQNDLMNSVEEIFEETRWEYWNLLKLKVEYGFPLTKQGGRPCLSRAALKAWISDVAGGVPMEKLNFSILQRLQYRRDVEAMEPQRISGLDNICRFVRQPQDVLISWMREDGCPIEKRGRESNTAEVDSRSLLIWMLDMGFKRGHYASTAPSFRIDRGGAAPPEFY